MKTEIIKSRNEILTPTCYKKYQWMTKDVLALMNERRQFKNSDNQITYKELDKNIKPKFR